MRHLAATAFAASALLAAGCSSLDSVNPFATDTRKMAALKDIKPSLEIKTVWSTSIGGGRESVFTPAVVGDSIYAAARDGSIVRYDNGKQKWKISTRNDLSGGVGADNRLVVVGTPKGEVLAFDTDGKQKWSARASSEVLAVPALAGDLVIVRSGDNRIFAFDAVDGSRKWVYQRNNPTLALRTSVGVVIDGGFAFAGFPGGKLVAIELKSGVGLWEGTVALPKGSTELERVADISSLPIIAGNQVCAAAYQGRVACFNLQNGQMLWSRDVSSFSGIAVDGRNLYVSDEKGAVHAFELATGTSVWKQDALAWRSVSTPLPVRGAVAVGDAEGYVHFLNTYDGAFVARAKTDGTPITASPQAHGKQGVLVQTRGGGLYAINIQ